MHAKMIVKMLLLAGSMAVGVSANAGVAVGIAVPGVAVSIGDPGYYGAVEVGGYQPQVLNAAPLIVRPVVGVAVAPLYLRVPVLYSSHWRSYCNLYQACGRPVYFVNESWYNNTYAPRYRTEHRGFDRHAEVRQEMRNIARHDEQRHEERGHDGRK